MGDKQPSNKKPGDKKPNRSLRTTLVGGWPSNLQEALLWLLYTFCAATLSFVAAGFIDVAKFGRLDLHHIIGHGELYAFISSLLMGSMLLVSKDKDLEPFKWRPIFTLLLFITAITAEIGFVLLKLTSNGDLQWVPMVRVQNFSLYLAVFCLFLVFIVVLIDASRINTEEALDRVESGYIALSSKMDKLP